ncbi:MULTISPECIES: autotransporter outer membrane beta-barrel domain-containing protein [unclassified Enterobacter]|uniref:autotransporter family protein n=1 Tax=unclassified Enterobacter TaxID=2608935 RepID=UPI001962F035|nr:MULTISPECIES: autotransporter outer membrane beta-barrel domain-containing protein [unclassified Enterobacter]
MKNKALTLVPVCLAGLTGMLPFPATAACSSSTPNSGDTVTCSGSGIPPVVATAGSNNVTINLGSTVIGSYSLTTQATPFSVDSGSSINNAGALTLSDNGTGVANRGALLLGVNNGNTLTNGATGTLTTTGAYNDGMAANGNNNTLINNGTITTSGNNSYGMTAAWGQSNPGAAGNTITNTGTISTSGNNARAISLLGGSGTVNNSGTLSTSGRDAPTVFLQGNNATLNNSGLIQATGTASSSGSVDGVVANTLGSSFNTTINNLAGGQIVSNNGIGIRSTNGNITITNAGLIQGGSGTAILSGNGSISLILQTGSQIIGLADGGRGNNSVTLEGTGTSSNAFTNFQTLTMTGSDWTWAGTGAFTTALVQSGTLDLTGMLGTSTASVTASVSNGATLQANSTNLPLSVSNDGMVRFLQNSDGSYSGKITGSGAVEKSGGGLLQVTGANTYTGGTTLTGGTLQAAADSALGEATGGLIFNGGTLQLGSSFDLATSRAISVTANNGTFDTQGFTSVVGQGITGAGALTKLGGGTLVLNGVNSYAGGTAVNAGTLVVGDSAHTSAAAAGTTTVAAGATLGGYGTVNGDVTNSGTLAVTNALPILSAGPQGNFQIYGNLTNVGLVQLAGSGVGNSLTVAGNYSGQNGVIALNTVLASDGAASDKLILSGGSASGSSTLKVTNIGGAGAQTTADGIQVVQATNGATSTANAFTLSGGTVSAGAYSYYLAKGGVSDGSGGSWDLRNTVVPDSTTSVTPAEETPESIVDASHGDEKLNVYRPEVALYAEAPAVARQLNLQQIYTFHDRQGEQSLLGSDNKAPAFWARSWGSHADIHQNGDVNPSFNGTLWGLQLGQDLYTATEDNGATHHFGILFGFSRATGDVDGFALAKQGMRVGKLQLNNYNYGGYWTRVAASGWYTDAVLMGSALRLNTNSVNEVNASSSGNAVTGSVETGLPVSLGEGVTLEPQVQLIWQRTSLDSLNDGVSDVRWNNGNTWQGRVGARLQWAFEASGVSWKPYLRANVLRSFGQDDETAFDSSTTIASNVGQTAGQIGAGLVAQVSQSGSLYATTGYLTNFGGERQRVVTGNVGVRWNW